MIEGTAYPILEENFTDHILQKHYTPDEQELEWAAQFNTALNKVGFLVQLKLFRKLGYFSSIPEAPETVIVTVCNAMGLLKVPTTKELRQYEKSGNKLRSINAIRQLLGIRQFQNSDNAWLMNLAEKAAQTKEAVQDIINVLLEELVHHHFELPGLSHLERIARNAKKKVNDAYFSEIAGGLTRSTKAQIDELLKVSDGNVYSSWNQLKREPKRPTVTEIRSFLQHVSWLLNLKAMVPKITIPGAKLRQYMFEARALNAQELSEIRPQKRYALAAIMIRTSHAKALDDIADIFTRIVSKMEKSAQDALQNYILNQQKTVDELVTTLRDMLLACVQQAPGEQKLKDIESAITPDPETLIDKCDEHLAHSGSNYLPFLLSPYKSKRALLFGCLNILSLKSSSSDKTTEKLLTLLMELQTVRKEHLDADFLTRFFNSKEKASRWTTHAWMKLIVLKHKNEEQGYALHRKFLELAILVTLKQELRSGDLHVVDGSEYDNFKNRYVSMERVKAELPAFAAQVQLPLTDSKAYINYLKDMLTQKTYEVDTRFPKNTHASIDDGKISLKQLRKKLTPEQVKALNDVIDEKLEQVSILDALIDVEHRLNLKRHFYPLSGHDGKLEDPEFRFITNLFCYGCNLGPTQTANSIKGLLSARQLAWLNIKYVTEDRLDLALRDVINDYNKFDLPTFWGTGKKASVDGTKWDLYEQNMISSYHIRYGGYGGLGYYHVSDTYIALFSHFIPCGVYEAVYILDGLLKNTSDIQPDTIHGDTQAQSFPVFGLSHLLGIKLMPRIRNIQDLNLYKPDRDCKYENIEDLFSGTINFELIEKHLPDMLQIAISIKLGMLTPSTLLKRLGTYSRKNKVYFAFKELGKVIRTLFLLDYIDKPELRHTINAETNKSEEFNDFIKWFFFGDKGIISENVRHEQVKIIKYNQLVANMMILYNTDKLTRIFRELKQNGEVLSPEVLSHFSPYRKAHFNRLGDYTVDIDRVTSPFEYKITP